MFDSDLIKTFKELFDIYDLQELKNLLEMKSFLVIGSLFGWIFAGIQIIQAIIKMMTVFIKGLKS